MVTPEEEFNQKVWEVLQKIKRAKLETVGNKPVEFNFPSVVGVLLRVSMMKNEMSIGQSRKR